MTASLDRLNRAENQRRTAALLVLRTYQAGACKRPRRRAGITQQQVPHGRAGMAVAQRPDLLGEPMGIFERLHRVSRAVIKMVDRECAGFGFSHGDLEVLALLRRADSQCRTLPSDLSARLALTSGGVTGRLDRLQHTSLLLRVPDADDRRRLHVRLTERGITMTDQALTATSSILRELLQEAFSTQQTDWLNEALRELADSVQERRHPPLYHHS